MRDEWPDWMDEDDEPAARPTRLRRLAALAAVPWLLVAVLVVRASAGDDVTAAPDVAPSGSAAPDDAAATGDGPPASDHAPPAPSDDEGEAPAPVEDSLTAPADSPTSLVEELELLAWQGGYRQTPGDGVVVSVALVAARAWLTGLDPQLGIDGLAPPEAGRYAEHLAFEALERPAPGAAVVTFAAVALRSGDEARAEVIRLAVPIDEHGPQPQPAGAPWLLPAPDLEIRPPATAEEVDEEHWPAAREALATAGFDDVELRGLQRTTSWPVLATVRRADGTDLVVWLRRHLHQFVVAGLPLQDALPPSAGPPDVETTDSEDRP